MNQSRLKYLIILVSCMAVGMTVLTACLIIEYRFFVRQLDELTQLKQEYDNYLLLFKRMILQEENQDADKEEPEGSEKKKVVESEDTFLLVNRDPEYLKKSAQSHGRQHKLEQAVAQLYQPRSQHARSSKTGVKTQGRKRSRKSMRQLSLTREYGSEAQDVAHEMAFVWPMDKKHFWLSYGFGPRKHPNGTWEFHRGIDLAAPKGTPVLSSAAGVVVDARYAGGYGNMVVVAHNKKFATRYAHLSKILVSVGDEVCQGDILGKVGATGNVRGKNGSHLHFEIMVYTKRVNPFYFLS